MTVYPLRILVSGVGRSGTTLIYQQLARMLQLQYGETRCHYEPYLWNITTPHVKGLRFGTEDISHYGIYVHKSTPLFLSRAHEIHDPFIDHLFGFDRSVHCNAFISKVIRGCGRLESYLHRYPDMKIIVCLRNPLDTINSSLGMFSFLGEEFHESDGPKLHRELTERGLDCLTNAKSRTHFEYSVAWWREFTESMLATAAAYPKNVFLFVYELFNERRDEVIDELLRFVGLSPARDFNIGLSESAGPRISSSHLLNCDLAQLYTHLDYYIGMILSPVFSGDKAERIKDELLGKYANSTFTPPIAADKLGCKTPIQLRAEILEAKNESTQYVPASMSDPVRLPLAALEATLLSEHKIDRKFYKSYHRNSLLVRRGKTIGCVITSHNNARTIRDAIYSALDQTKPYDQIVVVDDASSDNSITLLKELEARYSTVKLVELRHNVGVALTRHIGYSTLSTDYITQLDGDDCFGASKNFAEAEVLDHDPNAIAFSPILIVTKNGYNLIDCAAYNDNSDRVFECLLARVPGIPRDMTFARHIYFEADCCEPRLLYEDWEFKLRLASKCHSSWLQSQALVGTIYNRKKPTRSAENGATHTRALITVFLRYAWAKRLGADVVLQSFRSALLNRNRAMITHVDHLLEDGRINQSDYAVTKTLLSRRVQALSDEEYLKLLRELDNQNNDPFSRRQLAPDPLITRMLPSPNVSDANVACSCVLGKRDFSSKIADDEHAADVTNGWAQERYQDLILRVHEALRTNTPPNSVIIVVGKCSDEMARVPGRIGWHFPQTLDGIYAGYYPATDAEAMTHLDDLIARGAQFIMFPQTSLWWLDHYIELKACLEKTYERTYNVPDVGTMFCLSSVERKGSAWRNPAASERKM